MISAFTPYNNNSESNTYSPTIELLSANTFIFSVHLFASLREGTVLATSFTSGGDWLKNVRHVTRLVWTEQFDSPKVNDAGSAGL